MKTGNRGHIKETQTVEQNVEISAVAKNKKTAAAVALRVGRLPHGLCLRLIYRHFSMHLQLLPIRLLMLLPEHLPLLPLPPLNLPLLLSAFPPVPTRVKTKVVQHHCVIVKCICFCCCSPVASSITPKSRPQRDANDWLQGAIFIFFGSSAFITPEWLVA